MSGTTFNFYFAENNEDRFRNLQSEIACYWANRVDGQPNNIRVRSFQEEFSSLADYVRESTQGSHIPTFALIDPFGWSVAMTTIRDLLSSRKCEVLFSFMFDSVNRFISDKRPGVSQSFSRLFGTDAAEHTRAAALHGEDRKAFLRDLYKRQLENVAGFTFVRSFELINPVRGRTQYFLIFGTRHTEGLRAMKEAMWAIDPARGIRFSGFAGDQPMLFEPEPDFSPLRSAILSRFQGQTVRVDDVEQFVIVETDYLATHYKKQVLKPLEQEGLVACPSGRQRRWTYPKGSVLRFL